MRRSFGVIVLALALVSFASVSKVDGKVVLGVFAHPDDEASVGPVLAKYARLGHKVYVLIATDGQYGTRVTKIPEGPELARVRQEESRCASNKLGIEPPIFLSLDRLDTKIGVRPYLVAHKALIEKLKVNIRSLQPNVIITWGPDGEYGHSEHIVVGAAVQEALFQEGLAEKYPIYFPVETRLSSADDPDLSYVDEKYISASVRFEKQDVERYLAADRCFVSQFTPQEMAATEELARNDTENVRHFRRFGVYLGKRSKDLLHH